MRYRRFDDRFAVRLESGESLDQALTQLTRTEGIGYADVSAAGAVSWVCLGYWYPSTNQYEYREFDEQLEVVSLQGNVSVEPGGEPHLHVHGVFSRPDFSVVGGHVQDLKVNPTLEVWLRAENIPVRRTKDQASGLELLDLPEHPAGERAA